MDSATAARLERVAPRARRLFARGPRSGDEAGGQESSQTRSGPPNDDDRQDIARRLKSLAAVAPLDGPAVSGRDVDREADALAKELVDEANRVLAKLEGGASDTSLAPSEAVALEAVLHTRGRPAVRLTGAAFEDLSVYPGAEIWQIAIELHGAHMLAVAAATGAVTVTDRIAPQFTWVQGSAWLIAPDRAMTNRHVLFPPLGGTRLARRIPGGTTARLKSDLDVTLDFAFDNGPGRNVRYAVQEVLFVTADADPIDAAVLKVSPLPGSETVPAPLALSTAEDFDISQLYVVGHPGRMPQVPEKVRAVFGDPDERKRVSFGQVMDHAAVVPGEVVHDASTIGGFSGGCVVGFLSRDVRALHYYGDTIAGNRAITADALRAHELVRLL